MFLLLGYLKTNFLKSEAFCNEDLLLSEKSITYGSPKKHENFLLFTFFAIAISFERGQSPFTAKFATGSFISTLSN